MHPINFAWKTTFHKRRFIGTLLATIGLVVLVGCTTPVSSVSSPNKSSSTVMPDTSRVIKKMMVIAPHGFYTSTQSSRIGSSQVGSFDVQNTAQFIANSLSSQLNVAGYDTISMPSVSGSEPLMEVFDQRLKTSNVTEALVVSIKKATYKGQLPIQMDISVNLLDTASRRKIWQYDASFSAELQTESTRSGRSSSSTVISDLMKDLLARFKADGFVPTQQ
jgi:hypothetical protein